MEAAMENAVLPLIERDSADVALAPSREPLLARYRHLRAIAKQHNTAVMDDFLPKAGLLQQARRLGVAQGKTLVLDDIGHMAFIYDLLIHTAPAGRSRAIDRYAAAARFAPGSDEARMLDAMRQARFTIFIVAQRHETAGLMLVDLIRQREIWLMDEGLEISLPEGAIAASRLIETPDRFSMTAGVFLPIDVELLLLKKALDELPQLDDKPLTSVIDDRRLAETIYRVAFATRKLEGVAFQDAESAAD